MPEPLSANVAATSSPTVSSASSAFTLRKQNAALLAEKYTWKKRMGEYVSVGLFVILISKTIYNLVLASTFTTWPLLLIAAFAGMVLADIYSGLVHWGADTWGGLDTPVVGETFIRSFREHHVDPFRITVHDLIETNGDNCLTTVPILFPLSMVPITQGASGEMFIVAFLCSTAIWVSLTNQVILNSHHPLNIHFSSIFLARVHVDYRFISGLT
jgi:plasmanylethanolamine desaturase